MRMPAVFAAAALTAIAAGPHGASAAPLSLAAPTATALMPDAALILAGNSVGARRAIPQGKHKWTKRELRKGYYQQCGYDGYCTTIYNGT